MKNVFQCEVRPVVHARRFRSEDYAICLKQAEAARRTLTFFFREHNVAFPFFDFARDKFGIYCNIGGEEHWWRIAMPAPITNLWEDIVVGLSSATIDRAAPLAAMQELSYPQNFTRWYACLDVIRSEAGRTLYSLELLVDG